MRKRSGSGKPNNLRWGEYGTGCLIWQAGKNYTTVNRHLDDDSSLETEVRGKVQSTLGVEGCLGKAKTRLCAGPREYGG